MNNEQLRKTRVLFVAAPSHNSKPTKTMTTNVAPDGSSVIVVNATAPCFATSATRKRSASSNISSS